MRRPRFFHAFLHGAHVEDRLRRIDRGDDLAHRFLERLRLRPSADEEHLSRPLHLIERKVGVWQRGRVVEAMKLHARNDTNNLKPTGALPFIERLHEKAFANWILAGKNLLRERLIDHHNERRIFCIARVQRASAKQGRPQSREVIR